MRRNNLGVIYVGLLAVILYAFACNGYSQPSAGISNAPRGLALLIGINDYKYPRVIKPLSGCINDVEEMRSALINEFGFTAKDILSLKNKEATRQNILARFKSHLIANARPGDIVVFHFSGHGSTISNPADPFGYNNTIVPYDSRDPGRKVADITDKELNALVKELTEVTTNVTVVLDSCHSGTGLKLATSHVRAIPPDDRFLSNSPPALAMDSPAARGTKSGSGFAQQDLDYVLIAGCRTDQLSQELEDHRKSFHGALTFNLVRELMRPQANPRPTYRDIMDRVVTAVRSQFPFQTPQLEGKGADRIVFSSEDRSVEPYVLVSVVQKNEIEIEGGELHGFTTGSIFKIVAPSNDKSNLIGRVKLHTVEGLRSKATVLEGAEIRLGARAIEEKHNFESQKLSIGFEPEHSEVLTLLRSELLKLPDIFKVGSLDAAQVIFRDRGDAIELYSSSGRLLGKKIPLSRPWQINSLVGRARVWARWFAINAIQNKSSPLRVSFNLQPRDVGANNTKKDYRFLPGTNRFDLGIHNRSPDKVFVYVLGLSNDGSVMRIYPTGGSTTPVDVGEQITIPNWNVALPPGDAKCGWDVLKLIAATSQLDLRVLEQSAKSGIRGDEPDDPLSKLLFEAALGSRGASRAVPGGWTMRRMIPTSGS